ncbi:MAG: hypothetical protein EBZ77_06285 [Chitinophagia bacterium]|nr:hypothetical protein [Chitinophagia bacterium]
MKTNLDRAKSLFANNAKYDVLYLTADGQAFTRAQSAESHANDLRKNGNSDAIDTFSRAILAELEAADVTAEAVIAEAGIDTVAAAEPATEPTTEPAAEPAVEPAPEDAVTEPAAEPATEDAADNAAATKKSRKSK